MSPWIPAAMTTLLAATSPVLAQTTRPTEEVRIQVRVGDPQELKDREGRDDLNGVRPRVGPEIRLRGVRELPVVPDLPGFHLLRHGDPGPMEPAAFVGVATTPVPASLRPHLDLPRGVGLVVERVEDNSPAQAAGLQQYDVLHKLDDQLLMNTEQFSSLVRTFKGGDVIRLHLIRGGKPLEVAVTLAEKPMPVAGENRLEFRVGPGFPGELPMLREGRIDVLRDLDDDLPAVLGRVKRSQNAQIVVSDPEHTLKVVVKDGKRTLTATDPDGSVLHEGPIDTPEQIEKLPESIRGKVQRMAREMRLLEPPAAPTPPVAPAAPAPPQPTN